ncbi:four helix bundle protein [Vibrio hippocampi]|uniref:Four helix bundle protein n=1 Tax=Vibrio hippocampi TaxID=654686 RepID=A0ABM8ZKD6_9VIBR|nr:four helix bundle protein [Vibrio hippocampi]CAH0527283.1 hypothetical protein VHP8226_02611 [Vibrio hippocampi]
MRFERLNVWKRSCRLCVDIVRTMDSCKNFGLKDQLCRSSLSVPSNIAEGEERQTKRESARFFYIAKGSCGEVITQLYIASELGYIRKTQAIEFINEAKQISAMLAQLIKIREREGKGLDSRS